MTGPLVPGSPTARAVRSVMLGEKVTVIDDQFPVDPMAAACDVIGHILAHRPHLEVVFLTEDPTSRNHLAERIARILPSSTAAGARLLIGDDGTHPNPEPTIKVLCPVPSRRIGAALVVLDADRPIHLATARGPIGTIRQALIAGDHAFIEDWRSWVEGQDPVYWEPVPTEVLLAGDEV